jgi:1-acyl-sn-glycerol-3-phosphate acyltransferase
MKPIYWIGHQISGLFFRLGFSIQVEGREHVPAGGCLLVANHASFLDPNAVGWATGRECHFLARKSLFKRRFLAWFLPKVNVTPIDQDRPDMTGLRSIIKLLQSGAMVLIFPEGTRTPDNLLQPAQPGVGLVAVKANVPILPARIFGSFEAMPRHRNQIQRHPIRVVFGPTFHVPAECLESKSKEHYATVANLMMEHISKLH